VIAQTQFLLFLGPRPPTRAKDEASRLWAHQLQLTIADWVGEVHDTHLDLRRPYYEEQKREAKRRAADFKDNRLPKVPRLLREDPQAQSEKELTIS